jgi:NAD(P)H-hydrate epimerase
VAFAKGKILLLKGADTLVTDGTHLYRNSTGNPGMATGGSGDVLTGVIAALLAQLNPFNATVLGAWVHGRAGDLARFRLGEVGMTAADILEHLPASFLECVR